MGVFSVVSGIGLGLMIYGKGTASFVSVWQPMEGAKWFPIVLMLPAIVLITLAQLPGNLKVKLGHPMLMGICLFSIGHLFANGDLASVLLFASFLIYSLFTIVRLSREQDKNSSSVKVNIWDGVGILAGAGFYVLAFMYHFQITGMAISMS